MAEPATSAQAHGAVGEELLLTSTPAAHKETLQRAALQQLLIGSLVGDTDEGCARSEEATVARLQRLSELFESVAWQPAFSRTGNDGLLVPD